MTDKDFIVRIPKWDSAEKIVSRDIRFAGPQNLARILGVLDNPEITQPWEDETEKIRQEAEDLRQAGLTASCWAVSAGIATAASNIKTAKSLKTLQQNDQVNRHDIIDAGLYSGLTLALGCATILGIRRTSQFLSRFRHTKETLTQKSTVDQQKRKALRSEIVGRLNTIEALNLT